MGLFKRKKKIEQRDGEINENSADIALLNALIGTSDNITFEDALQIPSVSASIDFISGICARVPVQLFQENGEETEEIKDDNRVRMLNDDTGDMLNAYQMKKAWVTDYYDGRGYIYINRHLNEVQSLNYVEKNQISISKNANPIFKDADIYIYDKKYYPYEFLRLCRNTKDGLTGKSIVDESGKILSLYYDTMRFEQEQMKTGGIKGGFIKSENKLGEDAFSKLREAWNTFRNKRGSNMMVLNSGMDFKETSATSTEMQLNENKQANANDITMLFLLSSQALQGANDDEIVSAVKTAVMPIIEQMEAAYNQTLLLESEKQTMYFACDTSKIERGDILKRYQAYQIALSNHFMQPDEVRYKEDLPALGLDFITLGLNDVLYNPKTGEIYTPNTDKTTNVIKPTQNEGGNNE